MLLYLLQLLLLSNLITFLLLLRFWLIQLAYSLLMRNFLSISIGSFFQRVCIDLWFETALILMITFSHLDDLSGLASHGWLATLVILFQVVCHRRRVEFGLNVIILWILLYLRLLFLSLVDHVASLGRFFNSFLIKRLLLRSAIENIVVEDVIWIISVIRKRPRLRAALVW